MESHTEHTVHCTCLRNIQNNIHRTTRSTGTGKNRKHLHGPPLLFYQVPTKLLFVEFVPTHGMHGTQSHCPLELLCLNTWMLFLYVCLYMAYIPEAFSTVVTMVLRQIIMNLTLVPIQTTPMTESLATGSTRESSVIVHGVLLNTV